MDEDKIIIELSLRKVKNSALVAAVVFGLLSIVSLFVYLRLFAVFAVSFSEDRPEGYLITDSLYMGIPFILRGFVAVVLIGICCYMAYKIFRAPSPFTDRQVKIARIAACIATGLALFEFVWGPIGNEFNLLFDNGLIYINTNPNPFDPVLNQFAIVSAAVLFLYSFVLKYATILQDNSDMTV